MNKRKIVMLFAASLVALTLAACGSDASTEEPATGESDTIGSVEPSENEEPQYGSTYYLEFPIDETIGNGYTHKSRYNRA